MDQNEQHSKVSLDAKKAPKFVFGKGWSLMNILIGAVFVISGWIIDAINGLVNLGAIGSGKLSSAFYIWGWIGFSLIIFGILGFWLLIPAFQKWWHTKRWLAWTFLTIAVLITLLSLVFHW